MSLHVVHVNRRPVLSLISWWKINFGQFNSDELGAAFLGSLREPNSPIFQIINHFASTTFVVVVSVAHKGVKYDRAPFDNNAGRVVD